MKTSSKEWLDSWKLNSLSHGGKLSRLFSWFLEDLMSLRLFSFF